MRMPAITGITAAAAAVLLSGALANGHPAGGATQPQSGALAYAQPLFAHTPTAVLTDEPCITCGDEPGKCPNPECGGWGSDCPNCYSDVHGLSTGTCPNPECG